MSLKTIGKKKRAYLLWGLVYIAFFSACSTQRNTTATRGYHELTTRYNIYFNAEERYREILRERGESFQENYDELLPFYPSHPNTERSSSGGPFDPVIEKTEKAIREHSITAKPRRDPAKAQSNEYRQWLRQEEFNPFLKNVWMLRGKSLLQNGDYEEALAIFSGILRQFNHDPDLIDEAEIWMLRTYTEMGRRYEAEQTIYLLESKKFPPQLEKLFTDHYTYYLIQQKEFLDALPQLEKVIALESDHLRKKRMQFLLGQIYLISGKKNKAYHAFEAVKGLRTPSEFALNATRWQSAISNDSLPQIFHLSGPDNGFAQETTTTVIDAANSITGNIHQASNSRSRLAEGRSLAENASLHRQWRSRNGFWQSSLPTGEDEMVKIEEKRELKSEKVVSLEKSADLSPAEKETPSPLPACLPEQIAVEEKSVRLESSLRHEQGMPNENQSTSPNQIARETTEEVKRRLEENAAKALQQERGTAPQQSREQLLKERKKQREVRIRERERTLKERQRAREAALKERERERARKIRKEK